MSEDPKVLLSRAAGAMAARLQIFRDTAVHAQERGDKVELHPSEMWEPADEAALQRYEDAMQALSGAQPLFPEMDKSA